MCRPGRDAEALLRNPDSSADGVGAEPAFAGIVGEQVVVVSIRQRLLDYANGGDGKGHRMRVLVLAARGRDGPGSRREVELVGAHAAHFADALRRQKA